jgi:hypothetical protein
MIKKLRNQPYAPKVEQAPKWEQRGRKKFKNSNKHPLMETVGLLIT